MTLNLTSTTVHANTMCAQICIPTVNVLGFGNIKGSLEDGVADLALNAILNKHYK